MIRKTLAALMLVAAFAAAVGAVPGVLENVAVACPSNNPLCGDG